MQNATGVTVTALIREGWMERQGTGQADQRLDFRIAAMRAEDIKWLTHLYVIAPAADRAPG
jgi:hypothetical protein